MRIRTRSALALALTLAWGAQAHATGLVEAYLAARANDPVYRMAYYAAEGGKENRVLGRSNLLPSVSASYSNSRNHTDIVAGVQEVHPQYNSRSSVVQLRQPLFTLDGYARMRQGAAQSDAALAQLDADGQELILRLVGSYVDAAYSQEQLELAEASRAMYTEARQVNARLLEKGEGTRTDVLETQARLDLAEAKVLEAKDTQQASLTALSGIVGAPVSVLDRLGPEFRLQPPDGDFDTFRARALANNPDLRVQHYAIEIAHQEVNKQRAGHTPRLDFVASYSKNSSDTINTLGQDSTVRSLGIQINIPLYAGGAVNAQTRQAQANQERARADLQNKTDKVIVDLRKDYDGLRSGATRIAALGRAVESATLLIKATEQSIKGGVRINLDLLNAQEQLYTAKRDLAQARYTYLLNTLRLNAAAGMLTLGDVQAIAVNFR